MSSEHREIPYNYTSADDRQVVMLLFGGETWEALERLRAQRVTGRSARLLLRLIGDLFVLCRNPYLYQDLLDAPLNRASYFREARADLAIIAATADDNPDVAAVVASLERALADLDREITRTPGRQRRLRRRLAPIVGGHNIAFDPFSLIAHATDATDWRLHLPVAVITPEREEDVAPLLEECARIGLRIIPRGGGTGLTGGAVPLRSGLAIINTEKLDRIHGLRPMTFTTRRGPVEAAVIRLGAGVITETAIEEAAREGWVFATDPTSAWASTIGGNIAENAGGKNAKFTASSNTPSRAGAASRTKPENTPSPPVTDFCAESMIPKPPTITPPEKANPGNSSMPPSRAGMSGRWSMNSPVTMGRSMNCPAVAASLRICWNSKDGALTCAFRPPREATSCSDCSPV
ncbi:MAG: DUF3683 domain-containing protein [Planctomycetes bacterium]|nr:DUF3683 domain-containing protein [Planctomycetota bacterium]